MCSLLWLTPASGQERDGTVAGTAKDSSKSSLQGALVQLDPGGELRRSLPQQSTSDQPATQNCDQYSIGYAEQFGAILKRIAAGDLLAVEYCNSGKDRSGVFSAILLTALGVDRETVVQDYLLTNRHTLDADSIGRTTTDLLGIFGLPQLPDAPFVRAVMTTRPETLESTLDRIG
jgi:hypothetical protein